MIRLEHWATQSFHSFLLERAKMPFIWGTNDCCTFAADAIKSITGADIAAEFRGRYSTKTEAFKLIKQITGGSTVEDAAAYCAAKHGLQELTSPLFAQRGDLVVMVENGETLAGVVHLNGRHIVTVGEKGLMVKYITDVKRAWRV
jgi:hypothetical protein